jgi:hypothetical protein
MISLLLEHLANRGGAEWGYKGGRELRLFGVLRSSA